MGLTKLVGSVTRPKKFLGVKFYVIDHDAKGIAQTKAQWEEMMLIITDLSRTLLPLDEGFSSLVSSYATSRST